MYERLTGVDTVSWLKTCRFTAERFITMTRLIADLIHRSTHISQLTLFIFQTYSRLLVNELNEIFTH